MLGKTLRVPTWNRFLLSLKLRGRVPTRGRSQEVGRSAPFSSRRKVQIIIRDRSQIILRVLFETQPPRLHHFGMSGTEPSSLASRERARQSSSVLIELSFSPVRLPRKQRENAGFSRLSLEISHNVGLDGGGNSHLRTALWVPKFPGNREIYREFRRFRVLHCAGMLRKSQMHSGIAAEVARSLRNQNRELNASIREWEFPDTKLEQGFSPQSIHRSSLTVAAMPSDRNELMPELGRTYLWVTEISSPKEDSLTVDYPARAPERIRSRALLPTH
jgi:hypothetical protein